MSSAVRRTGSWVTGPSVTTPAGESLPAAMFVEQLLPDRPRHHPVVLVHGGGGQGTDWLTTPDGRPGWAELLAADGWPVHVVDRPGHGRSARAGQQPGATAPAPTAQSTAGVFAPGTEPRHTRWPGPGGASDPSVAQLTAGGTALPADLAAAQDLDAARLVDLLDRIGPAVLITHSMGAPAGWLAADRRPGGVLAVVAIEPVGPPFLDVPAMGLSLPWGLTAAPMTVDPAVIDPGQLRREPPGRLTSLHRLPIAVVETETSPLAGACAPVVAFLQAAGAPAELVRLTDHAVYGNGHGVLFETNNGAALDVVTRWLDGALTEPATPPH